MAHKGFRRPTGLNGNVRWGSHWMRNVLCVCTCTSQVCFKPGASQVTQVVSFACVVQTCFIFSGGGVESVCKSTTL